MTLPEPVENGLAATKIAERSPAAAGALVAFMDVNARHAEQIEGLVRLGIEIERDEWKARALDAEARLDRIEQRLFRLFS